MSNPKDKAKELVDKYDNTLTYLESKSKAKECALIAVNEIIKALRKDLAIFELSKGFWQEVKKELEKL